MNLDAPRSTARVVRLADLDTLYKAPVVSSELESLSSAPATPGLDRLAQGSSNDSQGGLASDWALSSGQAGRSPQPIGSTVPGALSEPEVRPNPHTRDVPRLPSGVVLQLPVRFDATASGYARVWLGNVLLLLCTLGLAWPWTYRRGQRYLLRHTMIAGHRLDYRLPARVLWLRLGLTTALWSGVAVAALGSPWAGWAALALCGAVWPLLVYLRVMQRVASVTWAGRRLWFDGPWQGVYQTTLVSLVLGVSTIGAVLLAWHGQWGGAWALAGLLATAWALYLPIRCWNFFHYRQHHILLGPMRLLWKASRGAMLVAFARTAVWAVLIGSLMGGLALAVLGAWQALHGAVSSRTLMVGAVLLGWSVLGSTVSYLEARLTNLVWNKTGNRYLRFRIKVPVAAYVRLRSLNTLRVVLTLGLYWPWAVVSARRLRMQSMVVWSRVEPEVLLAHWPSRQSDVPPEALPAAALAGEAGGGPTTQPSFVSRLSA